MKVDPDSPYTEFISSWPLEPDGTSEGVRLHPDQAPWDKCCGSNVYKIKDGAKSTEFCAYRRNEQGNRARLSLKDGHDGHDIQKVFVCCHRKDGEYYRACAGWAACQEGRKP